ncbi:hypothetical protein [Ancylobacter defluvii]|uniref:hypothetical protein n=1 Tax=Ancylobacter defluvii TaxID=1282440 RepID=UPI0022F275DD|nr:hypothetical protein [Ancylobacter defluvii]
MIKAPSGALPGGAFRFARSSSRVTPCHEDGAFEPTHIVRRCWLGARPTLGSGKCTASTMRIASVPAMPTGRMPDAAAPVIDMGLLAPGFSFTGRGRPGTMAASFRDEDGQTGSVPAISAQAAEKSAISCHVDDNEDGCTARFGTL